MKKTSKRIILFAFLVTAMQFVVLWLVFALIALTFPPDILIQLIVALPPIAVMLYVLPRSLYGSLVAKQIGYGLPSTARAFITSSAIFFIAIGAMLFGIYAGFTTPKEGIISYFLTSFCGFMVTIPLLWMGSEITKNS